MSHVPKSIQLPPKRWDALRNALTGRGPHEKKLGLKAISAKSGVPYATLYRFVNPEDPARGLLLTTLWKLARFCPIEAAKSIALQCLIDGAPNVADVEMFRSETMIPIDYARTNYSWGLYDQVFYGGNSVAGNLRAATADVLWSTVCGRYFSCLEQSLKDGGRFSADARFPAKQVKAWAQIPPNDSKDDGGGWSRYELAFWDAPWESQFRPDDMRSAEAQTPASFEDIQMLVDEVADGKVDSIILSVPLRLNEMANLARCAETLPSDSHADCLHARVKCSMHAASISKRSIRAAAHLLYRTAFPEITKDHAVVEVWKLILASEVTRWSERVQNLQDALEDYARTDPKNWNEVFELYEDEFILSQEQVNERRQRKMEAELEEQNKIDELMRGKISSDFLRQRRE